MIRVVSSPDNKNGSLELPPDVGAVLVGLHGDPRAVVDALRGEAIPHQRHVLVDTPRADA